jgi:hypothetical protein
MKGSTTSLKLANKSTFVEKTISTKLNKYSLSENKTFFHYKNFIVQKLHYSSIKNKDQNKNPPSLPKGKLQARKKMVGVLKRNQNL